MGGLGPGPLGPRGGGMFPVRSETPGRSVFEAKNVGGAQKSGLWIFFVETPISGGERGLAIALW